MFNIFATQTVRFLRPFYPDILWHKPSAEKVAYITIDDGPTPECSGQLMDILDQYQAKASFFLVGEHVRAHPELAQEMLLRGHAIGNHSLSHPNAWQLPQAEMERELRQATDVIEKTLGQSIRYMRPPYGRFTPAMRAWCQANGQQLVMWDLLPADYMETVSEEDIAQHILRFMRKGSITVLHDNPKVFHKTPQALQMVLETLSGQGWTFAALS